MVDLYLWVKAAHIIAVISWMAGLLYLPRLFVYHAECEAGSDQAKVFLVMERRLLKAIMGPAMGATWVLGLTLLLAFDTVSLNSFGWFHLKFALILLLSFFHGYLGKLFRDFADDNNQHNAKFYRLINEIPTVLMIGIVILVVVRPI